MEPRAITFDSWDVSIRHSSGHLVCAYIAWYRERNGGQREIVHSRHISLTDEALCDVLVAEFRRWLLEDILVAVEPF